MTKAKCWLPKAFEGQPGKVDIRLLDELWHQVPQSSKKVRMLIKDIKNITLAPKDIAIDKLAELIVDPILMDRWNNLSKKPYPSLLGLINVYIENNCPSLSGTELKKIGFFVSHNGSKERSAPNLEKLDALIEVIKFSKLEDRYIALFIWQLIIKSRLAKSKYPSEKSFNDLEHKLCLALEKNQLNNVRLLSYEADWILPIQNKEKRESISAVDGSDHAAVSARDDLESSVRSQIEARLIRDLHSIGEGVNRIKQVTSVIGLKIKNILTDEEPRSSLKQVQEQSTLLEALFDELKPSYENLSSEATDIICQNLSIIGVQYVEGDKLKFSVAEYEKWAKSITEKIDIASGVANDLQFFKDAIISDAIKKYNLSDAIECTQDDLKSVLAVSKNRYSCIEQGIYSENLMISAIESNLKNIDWNIFQDESLLPEHWRQLGAYYISIKKISISLGIIVSYRFDSLCDSFGALLVTEISKKQSPSLAQIISILSWLSLGQLERLAVKNPNLKVIIAITQLEAYLSSVESGIDQFIYWSTPPLADISHNHNSPLVRDFFKSIYDSILICSPPGLNSQVLARCVSSAKIGNAKTQKEKASLESFTNDLRDILIFRKKGGKTIYAHIWQKAYEDIFAPLSKTLDCEGIDSFARSYSEWVDGFDIYQHIDEWKSEIPDYLKKNSEYDKFIKNQVSLKISEVENWINVYRSLNANSQRGEPEELARLRKSINELFKGEDQDSAMLRKWLEHKVSDEKIRCNRYLYQGRDGNSWSSISAPFEKMDARHPRAFLKGISEAITYEAIYTDDFVESFGYNTTNQLLEMYVENEIFEGYSLIASDSTEEVPPILDRKVEKKTEEISAGLKLRVQNLRASALIEAGAGLEDVLSKVDSYVESQQWILADKQLCAAESLALDISNNRKNRAEKDQVLCKIERLGGHLDANVNATLKELRTLEASLLKKHEAIRVHVRTLEKLLGLASTGFERELSACLEKLDHLDCYPSEIASEQVSYYLEQAVAPLYNELSRSRTLLPSYTAQLKKLGKILLLNITDDENLFDEESKVVSILIDTADVWQQLSSEGRGAADTILNIFYNRGVKEPDVAVNERELPNLNVENLVQESSNSKNEFEILSSKAQSVLNNITSIPNNLDNLTSMLAARSWSGVAYLSLMEYKNSNYESEEGLANWAIAFALSDKCSFSEMELAASIRLINRKFSCSVVRFLVQDKLSRMHIGDLITRFINSMSYNFSGFNGSLITLESLQKLSSNISLAISHQEIFRYCFEVNVFDSLGVKAFWDSFSGETKQAEARAIFMYLAWKLHATSTLAYCLTLPPIDLEKRKAEALSSIADSALKSGNSELLQGFIDLKKSIQAKPFHIFVDLTLSNTIPQGEGPAKLTLLGGLERNVNGTLQSVLKIEPRRVDSPDSITIRLPNNCPVRFEDNSYLKTLNGPFFTDTSFPLVFTLTEEDAVNFSVEVDCSAVSLTGLFAKFTQKIEFSIIGDIAFEPLVPDEINDAFDNFPDAHMRGEDYVPRVVDEQKIEKTLFKSKTVRSVWISSPRRSGKTTMLYRILDAFSHKVKRDNLVVYLTLDESFEDSTSFNRWMWKRLRTMSSNKELRDLYGNFEDIGRNLPFDSDSGTFIGYLSDRLLSPRPEATRIIFLIDEIDRFASMYFEGGNRQTAATNILWQIRHTITDRRDIGMVFAGSSAAKQIFIANAESPFYNSIDHLELTPFSCKTKAMESASRQIVEPLKIRTKYNLPRESLEHLIWICAGIPYYMKLVAGSTYATAKQSHILKTDINEGLRALLSKETGLSKLDDMGGDPGSDDLRTTIALEKSTDSTLAKAVLYTLADIHSPISGNRTYRGKITSTESRLTSHYKIPRIKIERGLDICIGLGLIKMIETESVPEIDFVIPILGESLRKSSARYWANIDHELLALAQETH